MTKKFASFGLWLPVMLCLLSGCEALGAEGNVALWILGGIAGVVLLGWLAVKLLGGFIKIGVWGITILVLLVIGFIAWIILQSMGT